MVRIKTILNWISTIGVAANSDRTSQKETILSNKICLLLIPLTLFGICVSYIDEVYYTTLGFVVLLVFLLCVFLLNRIGKSIIARLGLSILPQFFLLMPNVLSGIEKAENYIAFSFIFTGFALIPLLLFNDRKQHSFLVIALSINLLFVLFFDILLVWSESMHIDIRLVENNYVYYKIPQIVMWFVIVLGSQYLKRELILSENRFRLATNIIEEHHEEIQSQNERLIVQNNVLSEYKEKADKQANKLRSSNNELQNTKLELLKTIERLKSAKDKLLKKEAEAKSILNALNEHYLVAQYDLNGTLISINTKAIELLGALHDEHFQQIKPIIEGSNNKNGKQPNGRVFDKIWKQILKGEAQTISLDYQFDGNTLSLATTFAPLFNQNNEPYKILAIGHDVSELKEKNEKIDKINAELKEKIFEISQQNQLLNFQQSEIFDKSEELHRQKEEIQAINESLELRVKERTKVLEDKNQQLTEYAFINSHVLRSPVSTIMGLINLINYSDLPEKEREVFEHLKATAKTLDNVVFKIHNAIDNGIHFQRDYLEPERSNEV